MRMPSGASGFDCRATANPDIGTPLSAGGRGLGHLRWSGMARWPGVCLVAFSQLEELPDPHAKRLSEPLLNGQPRRPSAPFEVGHVSHVQISGLGQLLLSQAAFGTKGTNCTSEGSTKVIQSPSDGRKRGPDCLLH